MDGDSGTQAESTVSCARCGKPAHLQCPKCVELKLPREGAAFCSQDCFKAAWSSHKSVHVKLKNDEAFNHSEELQKNWLYCLKKGQIRTPQCPHFDWTGTLRPYPISKHRVVPAVIEKPDWAMDGIPKIEPSSDLQSRVEIKTPDQIERMRETCRIAREVLDAAARFIRPGVTTDEIDEVVHEATIAAGGYPSPLNYHFFPKSCCTSVNEVICHGIPDARRLEDGDIVNVDVTVYYKGVHGDLNETYFVGNVDEESQRLVRCTYECLEKAISIVKPGVRFREVGEVINRHASLSGFSVVKSYCGHGIGELFHCAPNIPHYGSILIRRTVFSRERLAANHHTGDSISDKQNTPISFSSIDRQISLFLSSDRSIWSDASDAAAFLDAVDALIASLLGHNLSPVVNRAEDLLQPCMLRLEDEFWSMIEHPFDFSQFDHVSPPDLDADLQRRRGIRLSSQSKV